MKKALLILITVLFFAGCSNKEVSLQKTALPKNVAVIPFANLTQTPLAGYRVASISLGVLKEKGFNIKNLLFKYPEKDYDIEEINKILGKINDGYVITGFVNEFKYKAGIDAQPAVSITLKIYNAKTKTNMFISTVSEIGSSYDSLGIVAQKSIRELLDEAVKK